MEQSELKIILELHLKWLNNEEGGVMANLRYADLSFADLRSADLRSADLRSADLRSADLSSADLRYANLDFSVWLSMSCKSFDIKIDSQNFLQVCYHICRLDCNSKVAKMIQKFLAPFANKAKVINRHNLLLIDIGKTNADPTD